MLAKVIDTMETGVPKIQMQMKSLDKVQAEIPRSKYLGMRSECSLLVDTTLEPFFLAEPNLPGFHLFNSER